MGTFKLGVTMRVIYRMLTARLKYVKVDARIILLGLVPKVTRHNHTNILPKHILNFNQAIKIL